MSDRVCSEGDCQRERGATLTTELCGYCWALQRSGRLNYELSFISNLGLGDDTTLAHLGAHAVRVAASDDAHLKRCVVTGCVNLRGESGRKQCNGHHHLEQMMRGIGFLKNFHGPVSTVTVLENTIPDLVHALHGFIADAALNSLVTELRTPPEPGPLAGEADEGRVHCLYRFFDASAALLYVGITCNPGARIKAHSTQKDWWREVASSTMEHFDSREALANAERHAIRTEGPKYNIAGKPSGELIYA